MNDWRFRKEDGSDGVQQVDASLLLAMIEKRLLDEHYEFLPPGGSQWVSIKDALWILHVGEATPSPEPSMPPAGAARRAATAAKQVVKTPPTGHPKAKPPKHLSKGTQAAPGPAQAGGVPSPAISPAREAERRTIWEPDDEPDMMPMIDMTFLLLIFFMVTSTVAVWRQVSLPAATAGDTQDPENRVVMVLDFPAKLPENEQKVMAGSKYLTFGDARIYFVETADRSQESLQEAQKRVTPDQLAEALKRQFEAKPAAQFVLLAHRKMPVGVVREVLKKAKEAGAKETMVGVDIPR